MITGISNALYAQFESLKNLREELIVKKVEDYPLKVVEEAMDGMYHAYFYESKIKREE